MAGAAAALLDELMGRSRNVLPGKEVQEMDWTYPDVCKDYLCGFCPCDLFTNTRADIGLCDKIHDEKLRQKYQASDQVWKLGYEVQFLSDLDKLVRSLDRRVAHGKERLRKSAEAKQKQMAGFHEDGGNQKLKQLNVEINSCVLKLEELGQCGEVEGAQVLLKEVEALEKDRERERAGLLRDSSKTLAGFEVDANDFHEKMELCDVCGSFLVIGDSQSRVDAHLLGKQHLGYARIRAAISELKTKLNEIQNAEVDDCKKSDVITRREPEEQRQRRSSSRDRRLSKEGRKRSRSRDRRHRSQSRSRIRYHTSRSRSRDRRRSRSRGRQPSRSRRKSYRDRSRSREKKRSRSRERKRSSSREKKRSRSREKRSRSREKKRSRSREKRSRSREKKRSCSRERKRSHSREKKREKKRSRSREKKSHGKKT